MHNDAQASSVDHANFEQRSRPSRPDQDVHIVCINLKTSQHVTQRMFDVRFGNAVFPSTGVNARRTRIVRHHSTPVKKY